MLFPEQYKNKEVAVLGLAKSGFAAAKLFCEAGARVCVSDAKERRFFPEAGELEAMGASVFCGGHPDSFISESTALLIKNPGIPYSAHPVQKALAFGAEVATEVEIAGLVSPAPIIGITGSNGKTTVTTWTGLMLKEASMKPIVAGNIGRPLCEAAQEALPENWLVAELSSFQLEGTSAFRPRVACLLNLCETHLDHHGSFEAYAASKAKLFANQTASDFAVVNWDDALCRDLTAGAKAKSFPFSASRELKEGVFLREGAIVFQQDGAGGVLFRSEELKTLGAHNVQNALAACAIALCAGASKEAIVRALSDFRGVEHRLEFAGEIGGALFCNGSKATNPAATATDMAAFERPIVLIAGGKEKGMEYDSLIPHLKAKAKAVVAIGQTRAKILAAAEEAGVEKTASIESSDGAEAMALAAKAAFFFAEPGDVVLLSPACASQDMFESFEERGTLFKQAVSRLK